MKYEIRYKPAFACLFVTLEPGEQVTAESGAMVSMDGGILMKTEFSGDFSRRFSVGYLGENPCL